MILKESLKNFTAPNYGKTLRSPATYQTVADYCAKNLIRLVNEYHEVKNDQQLLREIRNDIDYYLRRYHKYCIHERDNMLAHYHEVGADENCDFEHLIPAKIIRDLILANKITVQQGLNAPTVKLSRAKHEMLKDAGWSKLTPDMWLPFQRYNNVFSADFVTYDGIKIDANTWTLEQHFHYFQHLVI